MTHQQLLRGLAPLLLIALGLGCEGSRPEAWERPRAVFGPVPLKDAVAYVDTARELVVLIDLATGRPVTHEIPVGARPRFAQPTPDGRRLLVLTRGFEARRAGEVDEAPGLFVIDAAAGDAPATRFELEAPFDRLAIAQDGAHAVAYFGPFSGVEEDFFRNPNELAVVALAAPPSDENPTFRTIRSFSAAPTGVLLSPPMVVPGAPDGTPRVFAFVLAPGTVTMLDVTRPRQREVSLRLTTTDEVVAAEEIVFAPQAGAAFVRASGARDVLSVQLAYEAPSADVPDDNDVRAVLAELGAGGRPADLAVYDGVDGVRRVIVATPGLAEVALIDTETAEVVRVPVPDPIDRILLVPEDAPRVAVFASLGTRAPRLSILPLDQISGSLFPARVETIAVGAPVWDAVGVPGRDAVLLVHDDTRTVLGLLDVPTGTVAPIEGLGRLDAWTFTPTGSHLVGASLGIDRVGFLALGDLHPTDVRLDALPATIHAMASGGVWIDHGDRLGLATFLPSVAAARADAVVLAGFLTEGLFDVTEVE